MGFSSILKMELLVSQLKNIKMNKMLFNFIVVVVKAKAELMVGSPRTLRRNQKKVLQVLLNYHGKYTYFTYNFIDP